MKPINSLEDVLGSSYIRFIEDTIIPDLQRLAEDKKFTAEELKILESIRKTKGLKAFLPELRPLDAPTLNTISPEGYVGEAVLSITQNVQLRYMVKIAADKRKHRAEVRTYGELIGNGTSRGELPEHLRKNIPAIVHEDYSRRVLITRHFGVTLNTKLDNSKPEERETILQRVIDTYADIFRYLNRTDGLETVINIHPERAWSSASNKLDDFNRFFGTFFKGRKYSLLRGAYKKNIGTVLNNYAVNFIHGDCKSGNILINGEIGFIDWADARENGFPEFDIAKLLNRSNMHIDLDREDRLVQYAANKLFDDPKRRKISIELYTKNQITEELISAMGCLQRSRKASTPNQAEQLEIMAKVNYNTALRRIERGVKDKIIDKEFLDAIIQSTQAFATDGLVRLTDEQYHNMIAQGYSPNIPMFRENILPTPLVDSYTPENIISALKKDVRVVKKSRRNKLFKLGITGLLLLGGLVSGVVYKSNLDAKRNKNNMEVALSIQHITDRYQSFFREAFLQSFAYVLDNPKSRNASNYFNEVESLSQKYGIRENLIYNIIQTNKIFAGVGDNFHAANVEGADVFDPLIAKSNYGMNKPINNPIENLRFGVRRLHKLIEQTGSEKQAVTLFYDPTHNIFAEDGTPLYSTVNTPFSSTYYSEDLIQEFKQNGSYGYRSLVYSALNGTMGDFAGGTFIKYLSIPPDSFKIDTGNIPGTSSK